MKKKLIALLALTTMIFAFSACDSSKEPASESDTNTTAEEPAGIDRTLDAVSEELGLSGGEETMYEMIGATAGKEYNDGSVEVYQFEEDSDAYKAIVDGNGTITAAATNSGFVLVFPNESDDKIVEAFNNITFK